MGARAFLGLEDFSFALSNERMPPQILREEMAMAETDHIGVSALDNAFSRWRALKGDQETPPLWSAFKPFDYPDMLPNIVLHQRIGNRYRCSIMGEHPSDHLPIKMAGSFIDEVMPPANLSDMLFRFNAALDSGQPNFVEKTMAWEPGGDLRSYRSIQLPFLESAADGGRVLSVMDFQVKLI